MAKTRSDRRGNSAAFSHHTLDPAEQRAGLVERIGVRHGVAARHKGVGAGTSNETVHVEAAFSRNKDDFTGANAGEGMSNNLNHVAGPKSGEHAFAADSQAQVAAVPQDVHC